MKVPRSHGFIERVLYAVVICEKQAHTMYIIFHIKEADFLEVEEYCSKEFQRVPSDITPESLYPNIVN